MPLGCVLDCGIVVPMLLAGLWANSLTPLGETLRAGLLIGLEVFLLVMLRRIHRRRFAAYDYGAAMLLGAAWVLGAALIRLSDPPSQPAIGVAAAALVAFANLGVNAAVLRAVWRAGRDGTSIIMAGQIRSRIARLVASVLAAGAIAVNAVWGAEGPGRLADVAGSILVVVTMVALGTGLWREALPHLLDRSLDEARQAAISRVLARRFAAYGSLGAVRSRFAGRGALVEVTPGFAAARRIGEIQGVADAVAEDIRALIPDAQVTVTPVAVWGGRRPGLTRGRAARRAHGTGRDRRPARWSAARAGRPAGRADRARSALRFAPCADAISSSAARPPSPAVSRR